MDRLAQLTRMLEGEPDDPFLTYGIALEHAKRQEFVQAIDWLDKTLAIDADYCYAYFQKAKMLAETGDDEKARQVIRDGIERAGAKGDEHARRELQELLASLT